MSFFIWSVWAMAAKTDCEQVSRFATPVNLIAWGARELSENWISHETRTNTILWSVQAREGVEKVVARTFYSKELICKWGKK